MKYNVFYSCVSHVGKCRSTNQDNFICDGIYMDENEEAFDYPLTGFISSGHATIIGIFDGMGGEERGEVAAFLAAKEASQISFTGNLRDDLLTFCRKANEKICHYAEENHIGSMGTTAAVLAFSTKKIALCNIGDSKIYRFADKKLQQLSYDHVVEGNYRIKPPLSQCLGIPPSELVIDPYVALRQYRDKDIFLICSDGLTDMVTQDEIIHILTEKNFEEVNETLLNKALANGGKDNITIILCKIERNRSWFCKQLFKIRSKEKVF